MKFNFFRNHFNYKKANRFISVLIVFDLLFIITHVLFVYLIFKRVPFDWSISKVFQLNYDGGYPEIYQYLKYLFIILTLIYTMHTRKIYNYLSWFILFVLLLLDDAFQFHERFATWVAERFNYTSMFGLRPQDLGELTYIGLFGPFLLLFLILGYYYGNKKIKKTYIDLGLLFGLFLCFGIGIDMLHQLVGDNRFIVLFMIILEDGGEMITLSLLTWYFYFLTFRPDNHAAYLFQYLFNKNSLVKIASNNEKA